MKEEDLSRIKRYSIVEYLERKGIKPVRRTPVYPLYRSPLREETHPSFKVDTEKNLWIDYAEGRGGSIIDLCMRLEGCTLSEAIRILGQNAPDITHVPRRESVQGTSKQESIRQAVSTSGVRRLIEVSDTLPPHLLKYLEEDRYINLEKEMMMQRVALQMTKLQTVTGLSLEDFAKEVDFKASNLSRLIPLEPSNSCTIALSSCTSKTCP